MELDWIIKEPIDYEYKQYLLLDYFQKVEKDFEDFKLYPRFREISLHLANIKSIVSDRNYILLKKRTKDIDEEIVIGDLIFEKIDKFGLSPLHRRTFLKSRVVNEISMF